MFKWVCNVFSRNDVLRKHIIRSSCLHSYEENLAAFYRHAKINNLVIINAHFRVGLYPSAYIWTVPEWAFNKDAIGIIDHKTMKGATNNEE